MSIEFAKYGTCILTNDMDGCTDVLIKKATDNFRQYITAGLLFQVDTAHSFDLHQKAYLSLPDDENFVLEYAIELHRRQQYEQAAKHYERYQKAHPEDVSLHVWLSDCYINLGQLDKAAEEWKKADHAKNHTGIDRAINTVYGKTNQLRKHDALRADLAKGKTDAAAALIFLDANWEIDPWNTVVEEDFLQSDLILAGQKLTTASDAYKKLKTYVSIKKLSDTRPKERGDSVRIILKASGLILDGKPFPENGAIASDLISVCLHTGLLDDKKLFKERGNEILALAKKHKDVEMLNIYAHLQANAAGAIDPAVDKMGWQEYKDERFAISYFMGKSDRNRYDDPELAQALADFPGSATLYWIKVNCAKIEKKPLKPLLIELIKREFKTLGSDPNHFSYGLNSYFGYLATEK